MYPHFIYKTNKSICSMYCVHCAHIIISEKNANQNEEEKKKNIYKKQDIT